MLFLKNLLGPSQTWCYRKHIVLCCYYGVRADCNTWKWYRHARNLQNTRTSFAIVYAAVLFSSFRSTCWIGCSTVLRCLQSSKASGSFQHVLQTENDSILLRMDNFWSFFLNPERSLHRSTSRVNPASAVQQSHHSATDGNGYCRNLGHFLCWNHHKVLVWQMGYSSSYVSSVDSSNDCVLHQ